MSEGTNDLSRIVSLIMQNPQLIAEISNLARSDSQPTADSSTPIEEDIKASVTETAAVPDGASRRNARSQLLCALKPYVSKERAGAIDSMISIAEILEVMKAR